MVDQIVITEKTSQAKDIRDAVGHRYGTIVPAEGHLFDLVETEAADPTWKRWSATLLRPDGLYPTKPAGGGNKASKLKAIRDALRTANRVRLATDCDCEGQLIGQERALPSTAVSWSQTYVSRTVLTRPLSRKPNQAEASTKALAIRPARSQKPMPTPCPGESGKNRDAVRAS